MTTENHGDGIGRAIDSVIRFCLQNKLVVILALAAIVGAGCGNPRRRKSCPA